MVLDDDTRIEMLKRHASVYRQFREIDRLMQPVKAELHGIERVIIEDLRQSWKIQTNSGVRIATPSPTSSQ